MNIQKLNNQMTFCKRICLTDMGKTSSAYRSNNRKFDFLDLSTSFKKYSLSDNSEKAQIDKMLFEISDEDKISEYDKIRKCYSEMRKIIRSQISEAENEKEWYNKLSEEKNYYQSLLDNCKGNSIIVTNGKYLLSDLNDGVSVSRSELEAAISSVDQRINNDLIERRENTSLDWVAPTKEEFLEDMEYRKTHVVIPDYSDYEKVTSSEELSRLRYNRFAKGLAEAVGTDVSEYTVAKDDPMFSKEGYTVDNFLEKTDERIALLESFDDALKKTMSNYLDSEQTVSDDVSQKDITYKLTLYIKQVKSVSELIEKNERKR